MPFTDRMMLKISQIARLRLTGVKDKVIADTLHLSGPGLARILKTVDYKEYETALLQGHLTEMDKKLAENRDLMRKTATDNVPMALQTIIDVARQRADLRSALSAARELLDRDPDHTFSRETIIRAPAGSVVTTGLPAALFESISKDADGVAVSVSQRLKQIRAGDLEPS